MRVGFCGEIDCDFVTEGCFVQADRDQIQFVFRLDGLS